MGAKLELPPEMSKTTSSAIPGNARERTQKISEFS